MAADVVEAAQLAVLAANDQDALADDIDGQERAGLGERIDPARIEPVPEENPLPLEREDLRRVVIAAGKRKAGPQPWP